MLSELEREPPAARRPTPLSPAESPHLIPLSKRAGPSAAALARPALFNAFFFSSCLAVHALQLFVALPFLLVPYEPSQRLFRLLIAYSKACFGRILVAISSPASFGPTSFILTVDESVDLEKLVERDDEGEVVALRLAKNSVTMSNHQAYADWIYLWILFVIGGIDSGLCIILKASLQWVPVLGIAMQFFGFVFIDKRKTLQKSNVVSVAAQALEDGTPHALLIFPEGTLFSRLTRPKSDAFASTCGVPTMRNVLLPRSTGLLFCLRSVLSLTPDVQLYDVTLGYPGVPSQGYAQDYYTLHSIFSRGHSPPSMHLHLRAIDLTTVPSLRPSPTAVSRTPKELDDELTAKDRAIFQEWIRQRWLEKDELMDFFYKNGAFPEGKQGPVEIRLGLKGGDFLMLVGLPVVLWAALLAVKALYRIL